MTMDKVHQKVTLIGVGMLVAGILVMIFLDTWGERISIVNPFGVILAIAGVFSILWGFGVRGET